MIEPVVAYKYFCTPMFSFPIRSCEMIIYAKNKEEADDLFLKHSHDFFNQDINMAVSVVATGYRMDGIDGNTDRNNGPTVRGPSTD